MAQPADLYSAVAPAAPPLAGLLALAGPRISAVFADVSLQQESQVFLERRLYHGAASA